jgi:hypothetical protein
MKLYELAYACRLYQGQSDGEYRKMRVDLGDNPDLASPEQRQDLLEFLNKWGCRLRRNDFDGLKKRLEEWVKDPEGFVKLPKASEDILRLGPSELDQTGNAFDALLSHFGGDTRVAKTLHALRYRALPAWDARIKEECLRNHAFSRQPTAGEMYAQFVRHVRAEIEDLRRNAEELGYSLAEVPRLIGRVEDSYDISSVKLVDEYYWITITKEHKVPDRNDLKELLRWAGDSAAATGGE